MNLTIDSRARHGLAAFGVLTAALLFGDRPGGQRRQEYQRHEGAI